MRSFALWCLLLGGLAFFYCASRQSDLPPVPDGVTLTQALRYPAGRWEVGRYASAMVAGMGLLLAVFPKGR